jgi:hypothetical protein
MFDGSDVVRIAPSVEGLATQSEVDCVWVLGTCGLCCFRLDELIAQAIGQSRHHLILQLDQVDDALYCARNPPSTASVCPVIIVAAGPARKAIAAAISAGSASFLKGVIASMRAISAGSLRMGPISSVRT